MEVVGVLLLGMTNKEIARHLYLSPETVKTHISRIYRKLGVKNRIEAAIKAMALMPLGEPHSPMTEDSAAYGMVAESSQDYDASDTTRIDPTTAAT